MPGCQAATVTRCDSRADFDACPSMATVRQGSLSAPAPVAAIVQQQRALSVPTRAAATVQQQGALSASAPAARSDMGGQQITLQYA